MALDFLAGCIGGCAGVIVGHPLDTVKVRLQTQDYRNPTYKGTWHCFSSIVKQESVRGLFKGVTSPLGGVALVNAIVFGVHGNVSRATGSNSILSHFGAGAAAGLVQSFILSPVELAKTRLQIQKDNRYKGSVDCLVKIYRQGGIRGLYRGLGLTLLREAPSFGTYFCTYEFLTSQQEEVTTARMLLAGGIAGSLSWIFVYPVDVIKSRVQSTETPNTSALDTLRRGLRTEGPGFLSRGLLSTILRAFPTNAVTFTVVAWTIRLADSVSLQTPEEESQPAVVARLRDKDRSFSNLKIFFNQSVHLFEEGIQPL